MPKHLFTVIGGVVCAFLLLGLVLNLADGGKFSTIGVVLYVALAVGAVLGGRWADRKIASRRTV